MGRHKDLISGGDVVIETPHARVHAGEYFSASYIDLSFTNAEVLNIGIKMNGNYAHLREKVNADGNVTVEFYENSVFTGGTDLTQINRNRASDKPSLLSISHGVSVSNAGDLLAEHLIAAGGGFFSRGAGSGGWDEEYILVPSTSYLLRITNVSGGAADLGVSIDYYSG